MSAVGYVLVVWSYFVVALLFMAGLGGGRGHEKAAGMALLWPAILLIAFVKVLIAGVIGVLEMVKQ